MSVVTAPQGNEKQFRAIVFKEGDLYVAQCLEYDISAQARDIQAVIDRLELTIEAEFASCEVDGHERPTMGPAPVYYHGLWANRSLNLRRVSVDSPAEHAALEIGLAAAA